MRERLKSGPAPEVIQYIFEPAIVKDLNRSFKNILLVSKAHLLMLIEKQIVQEEDGLKILEIMEEMQEKGPAILTVDTGLEDLYFNIESYIIEKVGVEIGGQLHTGRSRNDLYSTVTRLNTRNKLIEICKLILNLKQELLNVASNHVETVMTGYTHMQPAEPITFAHYLSGILNALNRDFIRLNHSFYSLNQSPLGSGAFASTSFPIDRERTAYLLGFESVLENSVDGVASRDYVIEIISSLNILMTNISRFSQDLYTWVTDEFSSIEIDDSVAAVSSIMPQKKNPITLEHIKSKAAHVQGALISVSSVLKNIPFSHSRDANTESIRFFWDALDEVEAGLSLLTVTIKNVTLNKDLLYERTKNNFSSVTELANTLVREEGLSFRTAHSIVAKFVNEKIKYESSKSVEADQDILRNIFLSVVGRNTLLSAEKIQLALDPIRNVEAKITHGGPAPTEVKRQLNVIENNIELHESQLENRIEGYKKAQKVLDSEIEKKFRI